MPNLAEILERFRPIYQDAMDALSGIHAAIKGLPANPSLAELKDLAAKIDSTLAGGGSALKGGTVEALKNFKAFLLAPPPVPARTVPRQISPPRSALHQSRELETSTAPATAPSSSNPSASPATTLSTTVGVGPSIRERQQMVNRVLQGGPPSLGPQPTMLVRRPVATTSTSTSTSTTTTPPTSPPPRSAPAVASTTTISIVTTISPRALIAKYEKELESLSEYSCEDYQNFRSFANGAKIDEIKRRNQELMTDRDRAALSGKCNGIQAATQSSYSWYKIKLIAQDVMRCRAAICTTFAITSAYILCGKVSGYRGPRIEIVSQPKHVFVIVGRAGRPCVGGQIPSLSAHPGEWGNDFIVVDAWMGSLGYSVIYVQTVNPFDQRFLDGLSCHWDSNEDDSMGD